MINAKAFGKYPVIVKNIYDDYGKVWAVCQTENNSFEDYLLEDLTFSGKRDRQEVSDNSDYTRLPVSLNEKLYVNYKGQTYPVYVTAIRIDNKRHNNRICVCGTFHFSEDYAHDYSATFSFDSVGKTLFKSPEDAQKRNGKRS